MLKKLTPFLILLLFLPLFAYAGSSVITGDYNVNVATSCPKNFGAEDCTPDYILATGANDGGKICATKTLMDSRANAATASSCANRGGILECDGQCRFTSSTTYCNTYNKDTTTVRIEPTSVTSATYNLPNLNQCGGCKAGYTDYDNDGTCDAQKYTVLTDNGTNFWSQTTPLTSFTISNPWAPATGGINYSGGNVGIGDTTPTNLLDITTAASDTSGINFNGRVALTADSSDTWLRLNDASQFTSGVYTPGNLRFDGNLFTGSDRTQPHIVLDSTSSGDDWAAEGAYIAIGESASSLGSAALYLTYIGDGYSYIGTGGGIDNGIPDSNYLRFDYDDPEIYSPDNLTIGGTLDLGGQISSDDNIYLNADASNDDVYVSFRDNSSGDYESLYWDKYNYPGNGSGDDGFSFTDDIYVSGALMTTGELDVSGRVTSGEWCSTSYDVCAKPLNDGYIHVRNKANTAYVGMAASNYYMGDSNTYIENDGGRYWIQDTARINSLVIGNDTRSGAIDVSNSISWDGMQGYIEFWSSIKTIYDADVDGDISLGGSINDSDDSDYYMDPSGTTHLHTVYAYDNINVTGDDNDGTYAAARISSGSQTMYIDGNEIDSDGNLHFQNNHRAYGVYVEGSLVHSSDLRLKKDIENLNYGLDEVLAMRPVSFNWKDTVNEQKSMGFIAQEMQSIIPEAVSMDSAESDILYINYTSLVPALTRAIQEQQGQIDALKTLVCADHADNEICN